MSAMRLVIILAACLATALAFAGVAAAQEERLPRSADVSVSGIFLDDPASVVNVLGNPPRPSEDCGYDFPALEVCNSARTEVLVLLLHYGDLLNSYSEFRVRKAQESPGRCVTLPGGLQHFVTGKGIRLGTSKRDLIRILGPGFSERRDGEETIITYTIEEAQNSSFLRRFNMPGYRGSYHLRDGKVVAFEFGYPDPWPSGDTERLLPVSGVAPPEREGARKPGPAQ